MRCARFLVALGGVLVAGATCAQAPEWQFETFIRVPYKNTLFLARDSENNVYGTTFNNSPRAAEVVAFKVANAMEAAPKVTVFDRFIAPSARGYAGITVDSEGNIYVSADQGDSAPSFIRKFLPSLEPDTSFGTSGVLATTKLRILGLTSYQTYVLAAVSWGRFLVIDSKARFYGMTPELPQDSRPYIRDIDIIPATQEVVGVERDSLYIFTGGSLANLAGYELRALARGEGPPLAGAAISYVPSTDRIYYTINKGHRLGTVTRAGRQVDIVESVSAQRGTVQPADVAVSTDGSTMFVSDLGSPNISRYRRSGTSALVSVPRAAGAFIAATETAAAPSASGPAAAVTEVTEMTVASVPMAPTATAAAIVTPLAGPAAPLASAVTPLPPSTDAAPAPTLTMPSVITPAATAVAAVPVVTPAVPVATQALSITASTPSAADRLPGLQTPAGTPQSPTLAVPVEGAPASPPTPAPTVTALAPVAPATPAMGTPVATPQVPVAGTPAAAASATPAMPPASAVTPVASPEVATPLPALAAVLTPSTPIAPVASPVLTPAALPTPHTALTPTALAPTTGASATGDWQEGIEAALSRAATTGKKVAVLFYTPESQAAQELMSGIFSDPTFFQQYADIIWVRQDVSARPELMTQYGFFKVPVLVVFGSDGKELRRLEGVFTKQEFTAAYSALQ